MAPHKQVRSGTLAPLLPEMHHQHNDRGLGGGSFSGAIFNLSSGMVGAGIMSIPATFKVLGIVPSFAVLLMIAFFVEITVEFLLKCTLHGKAHTYGRLMHESFGKSGAVGLQLCVTITSLGILIIYLIIIGDVLSGSQTDGSIHSGILPEWFGDHWWTSREYSLLFVVLFGLLPLVVLRHIDSLRYASAISILLAVLFALMCVGMAIYAMWKGRTETPKLVPDFSRGVSFLNLFTTIPVFATAFGCHVNVHPIRAELDKPSEISAVVRVSLMICIAIYFTVGVFGYLLFGESIMGDMLVNFSRSSGTFLGIILNDSVRLSYAIHLMLVYPIMNFALRANIDELLFPTKAPLSSDRARFLALTLVLLTFTYLAAISFPNIWYFFQFMGTTTVMCIMFIFPSAIILRDTHKVSTTRERVIAVAVISLAVGTSLIAMYSNLSDYFE